MTTLEMIALITTGIFIFCLVILGIRYLVVKKADYTFHSNEVARQACLINIKHEAKVLSIAYGMMLLILGVILL